MPIFAGMSQPIGVALALSTTVFWSISPLAMTSVGRRIGSLQTNMLRLALASIALGLIVGLSVLVPAWDPVYPGPEQCFWIIASAMAGLVVGDSYFYASLVSLGPRRASIMATLSPVVAVASSWLWLDETLSPLVLIGIAVAISAVTYAVDLERRTHKPGGREPGGVSARGVFESLASAFFAGVAAVLLRKAFLTQPEMDTLSATALRLGAAAVAIWTTPLLRGKVRSLTRHLLDAKVTRPLLIGTACGPILGMFCYVSAMKYAKAGLVNTLANMTPIMIIPIAAIVYRTRIRKRAILATLIAVVGVAMMSVGR
jgi:drug/metabolite transporter (DMT)-like permease